MENVFESMLGFGPIFTPIPDDIIENSKNICKSGLLQSNDIESKLELPNLQWCTFYAEKVDRLSALYYRLTVTDEHCQNGFTLFCESLNKDRFKVAIFNEKGAMIEEDECLRARDGKSTHCSLFFNSCKTHRLGDTSSAGFPSTGHSFAGNSTSASASTHATSMSTSMSLSMVGLVGGINTKDPIPSILHRLDQFIPSTKTITPGHYLILVFGDNYIGKSSYRISPIPFQGNSLSMIKNQLYTNIEIKDQNIINLKKEIILLKTEYEATKKAYDMAIEKVHTIGTKVEQELDNRDGAYKELLEISLKGHTKATATTSSTGTSVVSGGSVLSTVTSFAPHRKRTGLLSTATTNWTTSRSSVNTSAAAVNNNTAKATTTTIPITSTSTSDSIMASSGRNTAPTTATTSVVTAATATAGVAGSAPAGSSTASVPSSFASVKSSASAATGWFSKTISSGLNSFLSPAKDSSAATGTTTVTGARTTHTTRMNTTATGTGTGTTTVTGGVGTGKAASPAAAAAAVNARAGDFSAALVNDDDEDEENPPEFHDEVSRLYRTMSAGHTMVVPPHSVIDSHESSLTAQQRAAAIQEIYGSSGSGSSDKDTVNMTENATNNATNNDNANDNDGASNVGEFDQEVSTMLQQLVTHPTGTDTAMHSPSYMSSPYAYTTPDKQQQQAFSSQINSSELRTSSETKVPFPNFSHHSAITTTAPAVVEAAVAGEGGGEVTHEQDVISTPTLSPLTMQQSQQQQQQQQSVLGRSPESAVDENDFSNVNIEELQTVAKALLLDTSSKTATATASTANATAKGSGNDNNTTKTKKGKNK